ncbi:AbiU2 domain-containing protein [Paraburkholderia bryophila]|uniref:HEPN AbiU2-like domain-containing protein n=1 Tax=Paraburkholderia bryophila TaxID=420952 RepID=A0A7Y9WSC5_9BURK|nr:hypothetical protein [Paraburkholderia bryophila]NYH26249.1 hypothetical protein [Paraburkholderia bryophila]
MNVLFFLNNRVEFIRKFYETGSMPFREIIRKIEAEEDPFVPPYSEHSEPAYMDEWNAATASLGVLGRNCVSMLSESLKLYFKTWEHQLGLSCVETHAKAFRQGFVNGYRVSFGDTLALKWDTCPADFAILEQIVLARNADQHSGSITSMRATHSESDREKHPKLFFADEAEKALMRDRDGAQSWWMDPTVHVSSEGLEIANQQVEKLAEWLDIEIASRPELHAEIRKIQVKAKLGLLKEKVEAAEPEAVMAVTFHEVWKPMAYDEDLHKRMGLSYAAHAFFVVRSALRREMLLALMRLWDNDRKGRAIGMESIAKTLSDQQVFTALVVSRAEGTGLSSGFVVDRMRETLDAKSKKAVELISKYAPGGKHRGVLEKLRTLRNEYLAHKQTTPTNATGADASDNEIETFYQDNLEIVQLLLSSVLGRYFDLAEAADVYRHHSKYFWAAARGERTEGHPNYWTPPDADEGSPVST